MTTRTYRCERCGQEKTILKTGGAANRARFCSATCSARARAESGYRIPVTEQSRESSRQSMAKLRARPDVQAKIRAHLTGPGNPVRDPENQRKAQEALRAAGYPTLKGGNGVGLTLPQRLLSERLGWPTEVSVPTKQPRESGYPTCYKIDIADPGIKIGVECDGNSHLTKAVKAEDERKDKLLRELGWTILRFTNKEILADLEGVSRRVLSADASSISRPAPETT